MIQILNTILIILIIILISKTNQAATDCVKEAGKNGKDCNAKSTFISISEWNFIYEEDQAYMCCYYKGKISNLDYEGCFPFFADFILENKVNNLLDEMEKGIWELASGFPCNNPSIDCSSDIIIFYKIFLFLVFFI